MPLALEKMGVNITSTSSSAVIVCSWINISAFFTASIKIIIIFSYYYLIALLPSAADAVILLCPNVVYRISSYIKQSMHELCPYCVVWLLNFWLMTATCMRLTLIHSLVSVFRLQWVGDVTLSYRTKCHNPSGFGVSALRLNIAWLLYWVYLNRLGTRLILHMNMNISLG